MKYRMFYIAYLQHVLYIVNTVFTVDLMKRIAVNFRLEAELLERLKATAKQKALSKTAMLEECMRAALPSSGKNNGEQQAKINSEHSETGDIQALVEETVEQKVKTYFQDIEKAIAQIQSDIAKLHQSSTSPPTEG